jgi:RNA polymerase sigma factor (sigma-70 family)
LVTEEGPENDPTRALLERWRDGDQGAIDLLLQRELPWVRELVRRHLGPKLKGRMGESDCVQEAMLDFLRDGVRFVVADRHQLRGLLARIVDNNLRDQDAWWRARRRAADREQPLPSRSSLDLAATGARPSAAAHAGEAREWVRLAVELIDPEDRKVIVRRDWDGVEFTELGAELGLSANAARMRWVRAVARLGDKVAELRSGRTLRAVREESVLASRAG